jgi:hypothetical protein
MRSRGRNLLLFTTAALAGAAFGGDLSAQGSMTSPPQRALVLLGGEWHADLSGPVAAARAEFPLGNGRWVFAPGLTYAHYHIGSPTMVDVLVPEAQLQLQLARGGAFHPYLAGGAGFALINVIHTIDPVITLGAGLRIDLIREWGALIEAEGRSFGFEKGAAGWRLGLARRF